MVNPIDAFVLDHLRIKGLEPAPLAPLRTVLRRLSLDLTGLYPTPEEVRRFVINPDDDAYRQEVERLLDSPRFGERMASVWLEAIEFETLRWNGKEAAYRAYVVGAFNRNLPFDRFTTEQVAGVGAGEAFSRDGFLFASNGPLSGQKEGDRAKAMGRLVRTVSRTWLGATLDCAQCHDHPYDDFRQEDFRRMAAFFQDNPGSGDARREASPPMALLNDVPGCWDPAGLSGGGNATREDLANWLTAPSQPRTARVFVNRLWREFFGHGISKVVEDLGQGGEWPVHPELLDWLAVEFMESGWDVKGLVRLIVMSSTYRQSAIPVKGALELDPGNRWLSSQSPRPLSVAAMRDNALFLGGMLREEVGGKSFRPFLLSNLLAEWDLGRDENSAPATDAHHRRTLYMDPRYLSTTLAGRRAPPAAGSECPHLGSKPGQAVPARDPLADPIFLEAARGFAQRLMEMEGSEVEMIRQAFEWAMVRPASRREVKSLKRFLKGQRVRYREHPEEAVALLAVSRAPVRKALEPREWAAWIDVCRVILNLEETFTRY